jgi:hypothetical protein
MLAHVINTLENKLLIAHLPIAFVEVVTRYFALACNSLIPISSWFK